MIYKIEIPYKVVGSEGGYWEESTVIRVEADNASEAINTFEGALQKLVQSYSAPESKL